MLNTKIKFVFRLIYNLFIAFVIAVAVAMALTVLKDPFGHRVFVVQSGSMEPTIKTGSIVFIRPEKSYKKNDVITYLTEPKANLKDVKSTVTHRVVSVKKNKLFQVKGDANKAPDREFVPEKQVLGKVLFSVPYVGYVIALAKTQFGFIGLIIIPATLIVYSELNNIKNEIMKIFSRKKTKKADSKKEDEK